MKHGLYVCNAGDFGDVRRLAQLAHEAEGAGYDGFFMTDTLFPPADPGAPAEVADVQVALTAIALATTRIRFGAMVTPVPRRRPVKLAREIACLDRLSRGRLVVGAGTGSEVRTEFERLGEPAAPRHRADVLDESLHVIDGLLRGEKLSFAGKHLTVEDTSLNGCGPSSRAPIWVGGSPENPRPLRRAARWDGIFALRGDLDVIAPSDVAAMRDYIAEHRQSPDPFDVAIAPRFPDNVPGPDRGVLAEYERAGVTWWIEYAWSAAQAGALIARGSPGGLRGA